MLRTVFLIDHTERYTSLASSQESCTVSVVNDEHDVYLPWDLEMGPGSGVVLFQARACG
jgi:hypothetical protein